MKAPCPFCDASLDLVWESELLVAFRDAYPVTPGHTLIITRRHVSTWFEASEAEQMALVQAIRNVKEDLDDAFDPDGYNVGFNAGRAAGQTVDHFHMHVIPRYDGDMDDPCGGVRGVIPERQKYG